MTTEKTTYKILLPIDVAHVHPESFVVLKEFLALQDADLCLLYVREELPAYESMLGTMADFPTDLPNQLEHRAKEVLAEQADTLAHGAKSVKTEVTLGPPALMIETVAKDLNCDLIAMAPGTHSKVATYLLGSTCERVVKHARPSVLIIRAANAVPMKNVVIGVDGSESATEAMLAAVELFGLAKRDLRVTLVNVVSVTNVFKFISPARFVAAVEDNLMMSGEACLAEAEKLLADRGIKQIEVQLKSGDAATELINVANEVGAQLIVVGAQGHTAIEHFLLGGTSSKVATHAPCSTFVFKASNL